MDFKLSSKLFGSADKIRMLLVLCCLVVAAMAAPGNLEGNTDNFINLINKRQKQWKAGNNDFNFSMGVYDINGSAKKLHDDLLVIKHDLTNKVLPLHFDPRQEWPHCPSLKEIRDQSNCAASWAVSAAEAMTDRICISSNGEKNHHISAHELLTCCTTCGYGCDGGYPVSAWNYFMENGIVTGGEYGTNEGCQPYILKPCDHHVDGKYGLCIGHTQTPRCSTVCTNHRYSVSISEDRQYGGMPYSVRGVEQIMHELVTNGPVQAVFTLYSDFLLYKSGVYSHTEGVRLGDHAVKIIGYGVDNGTDYWLVANSWNEGWGDSGFFKIRRGPDECGIERHMVAGKPDQETNFI